MRVLQARRDEVRGERPHFERSTVGYSQCEMVETDAAFVEPVGAGVGMFNEPDRTETGVVDVPHLPARLALLRVHKRESRRGAMPWRLPERGPGPWW